MFRRQLRVFISYSHEDRKFVAPIVRLLAAMRSDVFLDSTSIEPGSLWFDSISDAITRSDVVVVFWCAHARDSTWVQAEYELGLRLNKRLMPLLLDDTSLPTSLSLFESISFRAIGVHGAPGDQLNAVTPFALPFAMAGAVVWKLFPRAERLHTTLCEIEPSFGLFTETPRARHRAASEISAKLDQLSPQL